MPTSPHPPPVLVVPELAADASLCGLRSDGTYTTVYLTEPLLNAVLAAPEGDERTAAAQQILDDPNEIMPDTYLDGYDFDGNAWVRRVGRSVAPEDFKPQEPGDV